MRTVLIAGWLAAAAVGCATDRNNIEYIPADRAVVPLKKGDPAPNDGWFLPPAIMQEVIPHLDKKYRTNPSPPGRGTAFKPKAPKAG